jgi:hypothetical protein
MFQLHTNQRITVGSDNKSPIILFRVWSFNVFDNMDVRNRSSIDIYNFFKGEFPSLKVDK